MKKIMLILSCILASCSSFDLGDKKAREIPIQNPNAAIWETEIRPLMYYKCDICHGPNASPFAPANISSVKFSLSDFETFKMYSDDIEKRVFKSNEAPMPPSFGTPLTEREKIALKNFIEKTDD